MSATVTEIENAVQRVPLWGWGALAGGAVLIVLARHNRAAAAITDPNTAAPDVGNGALPGQVYPPGDITVGTTPTTPGTTPDPGQTSNNPATFNETLKDLLGTTAGNFIAGLENQPDYINITLPGGESLTTTNGVATFGGGSGTPLRSPEAEQIADTYALGSQKNILDYLNQGWQIFQDAWTKNHANDLQSYTDITKAQIAASIPPVAAMPIVQSAQNAPSSGNASVTAPDVSTCNSGNYSCIRGKCNSGDYACVQRVAPWWRGDPVW